MRFASFIICSLAWCVCAQAQSWSRTQDCPVCNDCAPRFALRTNMIHDVLATPDLGAEVSIAKRWSVLTQGVYARWGTDVSATCWRINGGMLELRGWIGDKPLQRALTGHHVGVYGSLYQYDISFSGHTGHQSNRYMGGVGVTYGYSFRIANRLNLDCGISVGYMGGTETKYRPICGVLMCTGQHKIRYFGPTDLHVTLVWFPGKKSFNNPVY